MKKKINKIIKYIKKFIEENRVYSYILLGFIVLALIILIIKPLIGLK